MLHIGTNKGVYNWKPSEDWSIAELKGFENVPNPIAIKIIQDTLFFATKKNVFRKALNDIKSELPSIEFQKVRFVNTRLDQFINNDAINADSLVFEKPKVGVYLDRTMQPVFTSKIGKYPHQKLLASSSVINIGHIRTEGGDMVYTEKNEKTGLEGKVSFSDFSLHAQNITNDRRRIPAHPVMLASIEKANNCVPPDMK